MKKIFMITITALTVYGLIGCSHETVQPKKNQADNKEIKKNKLEDVTIENDNDEQIKVYKEAIINVLEDSKVNMDYITNLFKSVSNEPLLAKNDEFKMELSTRYDKYNDYISQLKLLSVPTKYEDINNKLLEAYGYLLESKDKILQGMEENNQSLINESANLISKSTELIHEVGTVTSDF